MNFSVEAEKGIQETFIFIANGLFELSQMIILTAQTVHFQ